MYLSAGNLDSRELNRRGMAGYCRAEDRVDRHSPTVAGLAGFNTDIS